MIHYFNEFNDIDLKELMTVYKSSNEKNSQLFYPGERNSSKKLENYEASFLKFIRDEFLSNYKHVYVVYAEENRYLCAARLIRYNENIVYLEAIETNPLFRNQEVKELRSNISHNNYNSLSLHKSCGFTIDLNPGYDYHYGIFDEGNYGMLCALSKLQATAACN